MWGKWDVTSSEKEMLNQCCQGFSQSEAAVGDCRQYYWRRAASLMTARQINGLICAHYQNIFHYTLCKSYCICMHKDIFWGLRIISNNVNLQNSAAWSSVDKHLNSESRCFVLLQPWTPPRTHARMWSAAAIRCASHRATRGPCVSIARNWNTGRTFKGCGRQATATRKYAGASMEVL